MNFIKRKILNKTKAPLLTWLTSMRDELQDILNGDKPLETLERHVQALNKAIENLEKNEKA